MAQFRKEEGTCVVLQNQNRNNQVPEQQRRDFEAENK